MIKWLAIGALILLIGLEALNMKTRNYINDDKDGDLPDAGDFCTVLNEMEFLALFAEK